jgi:prevent-host-death family protein
MPEQNPETRTMTISDVKQTLSSLVNEVDQGKTRILVEKSGIPVAALVSVNDLARLERFDREWEEGTKAIERFSRAFADVPVEEAEAEIARIIAEIRRQDEAEAERRAWDERTQAIKRFSQAFADIPAAEAEAEVARIIAERRLRRAAEAERQTA